MTFFYEAFIALFSLLCGFFISRWLLNRNKSAAPAPKKKEAAPVKAAPKVTLPPEIKTPVHQIMTDADRPRPQSAVPFLTEPADEEQITAGFRPRSLSTKHLNSDMSNLGVLQRRLSQTRMPAEPRDLMFARVKLTDAEQEGIETIKGWLERDGIERCTLPKHHASDDSFIGRFVRGKRLDLPKAYEQLKLCLAWRKEYQVDTIRDWYPTKYAESYEGIRHYFPWQNHGVDRNGVNVVWDRLPSMDFKVLMGNFSKEELIHWHVFTMETNAQRLFEAGQFGGVFIEDFTGLSMGHWYKPAVEFLKEMMNVDQQNYPEFSQGIFYINAPRVLSVLWPMLKPLMDPLTVAKVFIASDGGADQLVKFMEPTSIPREYGGQCSTCSGQQCLDPSLGGPFLSTREMRYRTLNIPAKQSVTVTLDSGVKKLNYTFQCVSDDVEMSVVDTASDEVIHVEKAEKGSGTLELDPKKVYLVKYSNEFSYWNSKVVGYVHKTEE